MSIEGIPSDAATLVDRVAIVTGAAHGIGRAIALQLGRAGSAVVVNDVDAEGVLRVAEEIERAGGRSAASVGDVRLSECTDGMVETAERSFGKLDILVNNAGVVRGGPISEIDDAGWNLVVDVILRGAFNACRSSARLLLTPNPHYNRKVITISSIAGVHGGVGGVNYAAAKAGLIGLSKALAREWAPSKINVNVIAPGRITETQIGSERDEAGRPIKSQSRSRDIPSIPIGRQGLPADVSSLAHFLALADSDYLTGQVIELHGGLEYLGPR